MSASSKGRFQARRWQWGQRSGSFLRRLTQMLSQREQRTIREQIDCSDSVSCAGAVWYTLSIFLSIVLGTSNTGSRPFGARMPSG
jgi:hypothetical protein